MACRSKDKRSKHNSSDRSWARCNREEPPQGHALVTSLLHGAQKNETRWQPQKDATALRRGKRRGVRGAQQQRASPLDACGRRSPHAQPADLAGFVQPAFLQQAAARVQQRGYGYGSASLVRDEPPYLPRSLQCSCKPVQNRTSPCSAVLVANRVRLRQRVPNLQ